MASVINQIKLGSTEYAIAHSAYAECATAAGTAAKAATISTDSDTTNTAFTLIKGVAVNVKFTVTNTAANPTLNINSSGAKAIYYNGAAITAGYLKANKVYQFVYNGTQWDLVGDVDTNTTYTFNGAVSTIKDSNLTASRALVSNSNGKVAVSGVTSTELGYLDGVTSNVQTQLNAKITKPSSTTANTITRYSNTTGDVKASKILIEDVTNTRDTTLTANVLSIPAEGGKKMVYGYCTDQTDGTSFIGGVFPAEATEFPYAAGLAIGGSSGNLLWKGSKVLTAAEGGGNITSHVYLTGAKESSSTGNTSQIVFGTSDNNHVAISSNKNAIVINPTASTTTNQIVLYLDKSSVFPAGITGNLTGTASNASKVTNAITFNNSGAGAASGTTFNGSAARTISYNTIGAAPAYQYSTTDLTANSSSLTTGTLYFVYE